VKNLVVQTPLVKIVSSSTEINHQLSKFKKDYILPKVT